MNLGKLPGFAVSCALIFVCSENCEDGSAANLLKCIVQTIDEQRGFQCNMKQCLNGLKKCQML